MDSDHLVRGACGVGGFPSRLFPKQDEGNKGSDIYSDDTQWQAYSLFSPDVEHILYGYAKRDSHQIRALSKVLGSDDMIHRVAVEISLHPDAGSWQFEVSGVLVENWVIGKVPFDESF